MPSFFKNIRRWLGQDSVRPARKNKSKLGLEQLEDRCVMATNPFNRPPTIDFIADQVLQRSKDLLIMQATARDVDGDPITYGIAVGDPISNLAPLQLAKLGGSYYDGVRGAGEKYIWSHTTQTWFYILPNGELHQFKNDLGSSPLVANVGSSIWANPTLLTGAVAQPPKGPSANDADAYALDQALQLRFGGGYFENHRGAGEKYMFGAGGWYFILPGGQVHAFNGALATSPQMGAVSTRFYDDPSLLHDASPPSSEAVQTWMGPTGQFVVNPPAGYAGSFSVTIFAYDGELIAARTFRVTVPNTAPNLSTISNQTMRHGGEVTIALPTRDADNDLLNYKIVLGGDDRAYNLDQQLGLTNPGNLYENYRGANEKYIMGRAGWYFILPTGGLYQFNGSIGGSPLVGMLDSSYHANPASLFDAIPLSLHPSLNGTQLVSATYSNGNLRIDAPDTYTGSFAVTVTASDGVLTTTRKFYVAATNNAPVLGTIGSQSTTTGTPIQIGLNASDPDGDPLQYTVELNSDRAAWDLDQQLGLSYNAGYFENFRGAGEKYLMARSGWHFILPTGEVRRWAGSIATSPFVATVERMYYDSPALLHDPFSPGPVGVQAQVSGGVLTLTPNPGYSGAFQVTVTAFDGLNRTKRTFLGRVLGNPSVTTNLALQLGTVNGTISANLLQASAAGSSPAELVFTVANPPTQGTLLLNGGVLNFGATFTQDDVNNNRLTYVHNGGAATSDGFSFTVRHGSGGTGSTAQFRIVKVAGTQTNTLTEVVVGVTAPNPLAALAQALQTPAGQGLAGLVDLAKSRMLMSGSPNLVQVALTPGSNPQLAIQRLQGLSIVQWARPNVVYTGQVSEFTPNDPRFPQQTPYHHDTMQNRTAWDTTTGGSAAAGNRVLVAVLDNGVAVQDFLTSAAGGPYPGHEDLRNNIWRNPGEVLDAIPDDDDFNGFNDDRAGFDFVGNDSDPSPNTLTPFFGHGTHVAGIVAAEINNGFGVTGVAGSAEIMPVRYIDTTAAAGAGIGQSSFTSINFFLAHRYAVDNGARIIVNANDLDLLTTPLDAFVADPLVINALNYVYQAGVLHINSAGNSSTIAPARQVFTQTLFVANTDSSDTKAISSNFGTWVDLSAPGENILSTLPPNDYGFMSGTSMAAANAAGTAALIWARNPLWTRDQVAAQLIGTTDRITNDPLGLQNDQQLFLGSGRVNSLRALTGIRRFARLDSQVFDQGNRAAIGFGLPLYLDTYFEVPSTPTPVTSFSLKVEGVFDPATVKEFNFELREAGTDTILFTPDDVVSTPNAPSAATPLQLAFQAGFVYRVGTNFIPFTASGITTGRYAVVVRSGGAAGLRDPFLTPLYGAAGTFTFRFNVGIAGGGGAGAGVRVGPEIPRNDTDDAATDLGVLNAVNIGRLEAIRRHADGQVDYDWFSSVMARTSRLTVSLANIVGNGDIHFRIYRVVGGALNEIGAGTRLASASQQAIVDVLAGERIFVWVYGFNFAQGDYDLTLSLA